jgi:hypothetical protein
MIDWLREPENRVRAAVALFVVSIVAWPITALTVFRDEPQGILGLSWFAIILTCVDIIITTDVRQNTDD